MVSSLLNHFLLLKHVILMKFFCLINLCACFFRWSLMFNQSNVAFWVTSVFLSTLFVLNRLFFSTVLLFRQRGFFIRICLLHHSLFLKRGLFFEEIFCLTNLFFLMTSSLLHHFLLLKHVLLFDKVLLFNRPLHLFDGVLLFNQPCLFKEHQSSYPLSSWTRSSFGPLFFCLVFQYALVFFIARFFLSTAFFKKFFCWISLFFFFFFSMTSRLLNHFFVLSAFFFATKFFCSISLCIFFRWCWPFEELQSSDQFSSSWAGSFFRHFFCFLNRVFSPIALACFSYRVSYFKLGGEGSQNFVASLRRGGCHTGSLSNCRLVCAGQMQDRAVTQRRWSLVCVCVCV